MCIEFIYTGVDKATLQKPYFAIKSHDIGCKLAEVKTSFDQETQLAKLPKIYQWKTQLMCLYCYKGPVLLLSANQSIALKTSK